MSQNQDNQNNLVSTTDSLEAISVFSCWKNLFFLLILITLLLLQASFWVVDRNLLAERQKDSAAVQTPDQQSQQTLILPATPTVQAPNEPNTVILTDSNKKAAPLRINVKLEHINLLVKCCNFILIIAAILYCLTILFSLEISLSARLGGINHISRAFFFSLILLVLLMPWQKLTGEIVKGYIFTPQELFADTIDAGGRNIFWVAIHYIRYSAFWLINVFLLIFAQLRTSRWSKSILRRLEVI